MDYDVFVSYSMKDKAVGDAVCATLESKRIRCWIAPRDIVPGQEWGEAIVNAIRGAKVMVLVFSRNANESVQVRREVERAVHHSLIIIPFRIEDIEPVASLEYFLSSPHWLDAITPPLQSHLERLADAILNFLGRSRTTTDANRGKRESHSPPTTETDQVVSHREDLSGITSSHETVMNLISRRQLADAAGLCVDRNYLDNRLMLDSPDNAARVKARKSHASDILLLAQRWPPSLDVAPIELCVTTFAGAGWQVIANTGGRAQNYDVGKGILTTSVRLVDDLASTDSRWIPLIPTVVNAERSTAMKWALLPFLRSPASEEGPRGDETRHYLCEAVSQIVTKWSKSENQILNAWISSWTPMPP